MPDFCHLHCHSQFSLLDGAASIPGMMAKAKAETAAPAKRLLAKAQAMRFTTQEVE